MMGYKTPNIDRLAKEGALFTDWYGQQSCTAGRAAFITGQSPFRTGLLKVGLPGAKEGLQKEDPTLMAAVGEPDIKEKLLKGLKVGDKTFKVHLDGYNQMDYFAGKAPDPRKEFFYFNDDGSLVALRYDKWKLVFAEQREHGFDVWQEPFVTLRVPKLNIRSDPFKTADHEGMDYERWRVEHLFLLVPAQQYVGQFLSTFKEFPPRQKAGSFALDQVLESLQSGAQGGNK